MRRAALAVSRDRRPHRARRLIIGVTSVGVGALGLAAVPSSASAATFDDEGSTHFFVVPAGVTALTVDAVGGAGGSGPLWGGRAAEVQATLSVTPGQTVYVHVAANGSYQNGGGAGGATNGGGASPTAGSGGGASDIRVGADDLAHRVLVAGGGGGTGSSKQGAAGDAGLAGQNGLGDYCPGVSSAAQPGTLVAGGAGGSGCTIYGSGTAGTLGSGGQGVFSPEGNVSGGGGGGGYYGGGGGNPYSGGAGGSSYIDASATAVGTSLAPLESTPSVTFVSMTFGQSIDFTSTAPSSPVAGGNYLATVSNGGSSSPVTFSTGSAGCTVTNNGDDTATVHFTHVGDCTVAVDQAGDANYTAATQKTQSMTVAQGSQSVAFSSTPSSPAVGGSYLATAIGGDSHNPVSFSTASSTCTVTDHGDSTATVGFVHVGDCAVDAHQAGNADFTAATQQTQHMNVGQGAQSISFTSTSPVSPKVGTSYVVAATGGASGSPVTFSTTSTSCTVTDHADGTATVGYVHVGDCVVHADQAGDADFTAAAQQAQSMNVGQGAQSISFTSTSPVSPKVGASYLAAATGGASGSAVTLSTTSTSCAVADHADGTATVRFTHVGSCAVVASQSGSADYAAAPQQTQAITVVRATQTIRFPALKRMRLHHANQALRATASSLLRVQYRTKTPKICSVVKGRVHALRTGTCTVAASQPGNADYLAARTVRRSLKVTR